MTEELEKEILAEVEIGEEQQHVMEEPPEEAMEIIQNRNKLSKRQHESDEMFNKMLRVDECLMKRCGTKQKTMQKEIDLNYAIYAKEEEITRMNETYKYEIYKDIGYLGGISKDQIQKETALTKLENKIDDLNRKRLQQMKEFSKNAIRLAEDCENLDTNINADNIKAEIAGLNEKRRVLMMDVDNFKMDIKKVKKLIKETNIDACINLEDITRILNDESAKLFGNVGRNRQILHDVLSQVNVLKRKIKELD